VHQLNFLGYKHLSDQERHTLSTLRTQGFSDSKIARALNRDRSTIYRETTRNASTHDGYYRHSAAGELYRGRLSRSRRNQKYGPEKFNPIVKLLQRKLSPEQIVGRAKREGVSIMCHETIYLWIWEDKLQGGLLYLHLRGAQKKCRKRNGRHDSRGRLAGKKLISQRPAIVEQRARTGDWEADTIHGSDKACALSLVERKSGLLCLGQLPRATAQYTENRLVQLLGPHRPNLHTITSDNGTEFHCFKNIEQRLSTDFYFATPYHAWERGTNENTNGLVRQYLPKRTSLKHLTQTQCTRIADNLNNRPRKRLGFLTPNEAYFHSNQIAPCGKLFGSCPRERSIPLSTKTFTLALQT
jgi:transposase, IS30 family